MPSARLKKTRRSSAKKSPSARRASAKRSAAKRSTTKHKSVKRKSPKRATAKRSASKRKSSARKRTSASKSSSTAKIAHISGSFDGNITCPGQLHFMPGVKCSGNFQAGSFQVDGSIKGSIFARNQVKLGKKAMIKGNIHAFKFVAEEGACFNGRMNLGRRKAA